jgi:hypothetical protein
MKVRCLAHLLVGAAALALMLPSSFAGDGQPAPTPREALQPFNTLVGSWKGTAKPSGTKAEQDRDFWIEKISWGWQFKDKDAWLTVDFEKSKHFTKGTLRYVPDKKHYVLTLTTLNKEELTMKGELDDKGKILTAESEPDAKMEVHRIVINMLHDGERFLYRVEKRKADKARFSMVFSVGATKEGIAFANGSNKPECVVSGGLGTQAVSYMGKTYYVCCSGCATEFRADPAKYVKEFEEKQAKKDKK